MRICSSAILPSRARQSVVCHFEMLEQSPQLAAQCRALYLSESWVYATDHTTFTTWHAPPSLRFVSLFQ